MVVVEAAGNDAPNANGKIVYCPPPTMPVTYVPSANRVPINDDIVDPTDNICALDIVVIDITVIFETVIVELNKKKFVYGTTILVPVIAPPAWIAVAASCRTIQLIFKLGIIPVIDAVVLSTESTPILVVPTS